MTKPILLFSAFIAAFITVKAQTNDPAESNTSIDLIVKNSPQQKFILKTNDGSSNRFVSDTVILGKNNSADTLHYALNTITRETQIYLGFTQKRIKGFIGVMLPGENLKMVIDLNNPNDISFTGSPYTQEYMNYVAQSKLLNGDIFKYRMALKLHGPDSMVLKQNIDSIENLSAKFIRSIIFKTKSATVVEFALMHSQNGIVSYTTEEFDLLRTKFRDSPLAIGQIGINEKVQNHPSTTKPKPANGTYLKDFTFPDSKGKMVKLDGLKGKYVLVDFWASWCGPCRKESPFLKQAIQKFGNNNFVVLGVSVDNSHDLWQKAIKEDGTQNFIHLIDDREQKNKITTQLNIISIPCNFLLDPTGKIIAQDLRGEKLVAQIADLIK